ncbi:NAD(P)H-quinone oxidoreductase [Chloroflexota bacterium]
MKAILVQESSSELPLVWQEANDPVCGPGQVLVDVHATSLNRADLLQRAGRYPPPPGAPDILGLDMAGAVRQVGIGVEGWQPGERVCALLAGGGYAEQVVVPSGMLMPIPDHWSYEQAAAVPEVFLTAYLNIFLEAAFVAGETVLMHGGASGVGSAAIQLVRQSGGRMLVTAGTDDKTEVCARLGAELAVNYRQEDFVQRILEHTSGDGVDIIVDIVGAEYLERNLSLLKLRGRMVFLAMLSGSRAEIDLGSLMGRRLRLIGSVLRSRPLQEKVEIKERFMSQFWPQLVDDSILPVIDSVYPVQKANEAHRRMADNMNMGKIVLKVR